MKKFTNKYVVFSVGTLTISAIAMLSIPYFDNVVTHYNKKQSKYDIITICDTYGVAAQCDISTFTKGREDTIIFNATRYEANGKKANIVKNIKCGDFNQIIAMLSKDTPDNLKDINQKGCNLSEEDLALITENKDKIVVYGGWNVTPERQEKVQFLPTLYYSKQTLYSRNKNDLPIEELLLKEKVAIQENTTIADNIKNIAKEKGGAMLNNIVFFKNVDEIEKAVKANKIDNFVSDDIGIEGNTYLKTFYAHKNFTHSKVQTYREPISIFTAKDSPIHHQLIANISRSLDTIAWVDEEIKTTYHKI